MLAVMRRAHPLALRVVAGRGVATTVSPGSFVLSAEVQPALLERTSSTTGFATDQAPCAPPGQVKEAGMVAGRWRAGWAAARGREGAGGAGEHDHLARNAVPPEPRDSARCRGCGTLEQDHAWHFLAGGF